MSRIHDALKRAEQERVGGQSVRQAILPAESIVPSAVETAVTPVISLPSSAAIPPPVPASSRFEDIWANCARDEWKPDAKFVLFSNSNTPAPGAEQFRTLRSRLYRVRDNHPLQTVVVSSALPAEGKTVVATNLAYAIVRQKGCRALLIDADIRAPRMHTILGAPMAPGLAEYLQDQATEFQVIHRSVQEGLCFIPAGQNVAHPSELIASHRLGQLIEHLRPVFDWILIDSPPALPVADASVLAALCDGVLLVVRAGSTPAESAQRACQEFHSSHLVGVVLNSVKEAPGYRSYYGYPGYGGYGHGLLNPKENQS